MDDAVLDNPAWESLNGEHAALAVGNEYAKRYPQDVAPFAAVPDPRDPKCWAALDEICEGDVGALVVGVQHAPTGWEVSWRGTALQMVSADLKAVADPDVAQLGMDDVPEILDLIERTRPGPFRQRTVTLGSYLGIRREGSLIAMAGERMHPPGWTEVSAVCTDPAYRGQGLASRLTRALAVGIEGRSERAVLHVVAENTTAVRLYESIGFVTRQKMHIGGARRVRPSPPPP